MSQRQRRREFQQKCCSCPAGVEEEEEVVSARVPFEERGFPAGVDEEEEQVGVPAGVPFKEKDIPAGVAFLDKEDEEEEEGVACRGSFSGMEEEGWEDLVAHMALLELYEEGSLVEEECLAAEVDEEDEVVEAFSFFALTSIFHLLRPHCTQEDL